MLQVEKRNNGSLETSVVIVRLMGHSGDNKSSEMIDMLHLGAALYLTDGRHLHMDRHRLEAYLKWEAN